MLRCLLVLALAFAANAQKQFSVGGRVVFSNGRPVANAEITLSTDGWTEAADPVLTDAQGRFEFGGLGENLYILSASRHDFGFQFWGQTPNGGEVGGIRLNRDRPEADILFRVEIPGVISGVVHDRDGNPMRAIQVTASHRAGPEQDGRFESGGFAFTDDRGRFRMAHLHWGRYRICAAAQGDGQPAAPTGFAYFNDSAPPAAYLKGCYPATVRLRPGQLVEIDFVFLPAKTVSVGGTVSNLPEGAGTNLILAPVDDSNGFHFTTGISPDRHFEFMQVSPGNYMLFAQANPTDGSPLMARMPVQVGGSDIQGLNFALTAAPRIDVVVHAPGSQKTAIGLRNTEDGGQSFAQRDKDGVLRLPALFPASYWLVTRTELCQQSAKLGGRDVSTRPFEIAAGMISTLEVTFTDRCGVIEGEAVPRARILLLITGTAENPGDYLVQSADEDGKFSYSGLPPGKYSLWEWSEDEEWNGGIGDLASMANRRTVVEAKAGEVTKVRIGLPGGVAK